MKPRGHGDDYRKVGTTSRTGYIWVNGALSLRSGCEAVRGRWGPTGRGWVTAPSSSVATWSPLASWSQAQVAHPIVAGEIYPAGSPLVRVLEPVMRPAPS